ncbi:5'-3' exonuclease [Pseudoalteromonas marina]|uniref:5'-3' exonuclease H3TH domain-containing protein n=1 Tax=Pseudoalteromonas marina TaxID=267375 RepID=A0ABT9FGE6_9GAMM|nr:5'-3' exonuclease H3TH domain-containing protein [Pseudoalteromonas marina]MDP2565857.1 5'-3' exonuclease H3TH domain-containing protein [Pseudoalteromonas marina]
MIQKKEICVYIIDVSSIFSRLYKALTKNGEPNGKNDIYNGVPIFALRPVLNLIEKEIKNASNYCQEYTHIAMVFDFPAKTFRHEIYPNYKKDRKPKTPAEIKQMELTFKMLQTQGYFTITKAGVEADDVIGAISKKLTLSKVKHIIFSGDKDMACLINDYAKQYSGRADMFIDAQAVKSKYGVTPDKMTDLLTIIGDTSDSVSGVPGAGKKNAAKLLENHTLDELLKKPTLIDEIKLTNKEKIKKHFTTNADEILASREVIELYTNMKLNINLNDMLKKDPADEYFLDLITK